MATYQYQELCRKGFNLYCVLISVLVAVHLGMEYDNSPSKFLAAHWKKETIGEMLTVSRAAIKDAIRYCEHDLALLFFFGISNAFSNSEESNWTQKIVRYLWRVWVFSQLILMCIAVPHTYYYGAASGFTILVMAKRLEMTFVNYNPMFEGNWDLGEFRRVLAA